MELKYTEVSQIPKSVIVEYIIGSTDRKKGWVIALGEQILNKYNMYSPINREKMRKRVSALWNGEFLNNPETVKPVENMTPKFEGSKQGFTDFEQFKKDWIITTSNITAGDIIEKYKTYTNPLHTDLAGNTWGIHKTTKPVIYLVVADPHFPAVHRDYFNHCVSIKNKYTVIGDTTFGKGNWELKVVFIGDVLSNQAMSYHEHNPDLPSAGDELTECRVHIAQWYKEFPKAFVTLGNHDLLPYRKAFTAGIPTAYIKDLSEVLNVKGWTFCDEIEDNQYNLFFTHGTKLSKNTIKLKCLKAQKSVIAGHLHSDLYIEYLTQKLFVMRIGCGQDNTHPESNYNKGGHTEPLINVSVIFDGTPILEIYKEK